MKWEQRMSKEIAEEDSEDSSKDSNEKKKSPEFHGYDAKGHYLHH